MNYAKQWDAEHCKREMTGEVLAPVLNFFTRLKEKLKTMECRVLDVGCGTGTNTLWLASQGFRVCGFDSSRAAISRMIQKGTKQRIFNFPSAMVADMTKRWPYFANSFDVVLDVRSMENLTIDELCAAWKEAFRVLKPNGYLVSLTASDYRNDKFTTVGKVVKLKERDLQAAMKFIGFHIAELARVSDGEIEDWWIIAHRK